jgi:hypothetical protein
MISTSRSRSIGDLVIRVCGVISSSITTLSPKMKLDQLRAIRVRYIPIKPEG